MNRITLLLCLILISGSALAVQKPKHRFAPIKAVTEEVIPVPYGRSVKLVFPWVIDEPTDELPYLIDLPDDSVFKFDYQKGQNSLRVSYNRKGHFEGEVTNLNLSMHGYHFSLALHSVPPTKRNMKKYFSLVEYRLTGSKRLTFLRREKKKIQEAMNKKFQAKFKGLDEEAEKRALLLVGSLSITKPDNVRIYEKGTIKNKDEDDAFVYIDKYSYYGNILVVPFEVKNDTNEAIYIDGVVLSQGEKNKAQLIEAKHKIGRKVKSKSELKGFVVSNDKKFKPSSKHSLVVKTNIGDIEVKF